jgi:hypothetical protein
MVNNYSQLEETLSVIITSAKTFAVEFDSRISLQRVALYYVFLSREDRINFSLHIDIFYVEFDLFHNVHKARVLL